VVLLPGLLFVWAECFEKVDYMADFQKVIAQIIANAWADDAWHGRLTAAGSDRERIEGVLREKGLELPEMKDFSGDVQFVANTDRIRYIVIPTKPKLTDDDVSFFVQIRQMETNVTDCFGTSAHLVQQIRKVLLGN
jgi:hypothetical protein